MLNNLKARYIELLKTNIGTWRNGKTAEEVADAMFNAIKKDTNEDRLKHNFYLEQACKEFGIRKSSQLRELVQKESVPT